MPLRLEAQALADLLKRGLHSPSANKPRDDPLGICLEVGTQQSLSLKPFFWVADQHPSQGYGGQSRGVPEGRPGDYLHRAFLAAVPVAYLDGAPEGIRIFSYGAEVGQARALEPGPAYLTGIARGSRLVQSSVQPKTRDEGDGLSQSPAVVEELDGA